jgi:hypothetical protein
MIIQGTQTLTKHLKQYLGVVEGPFLAPCMHLCACIYVHAFMSVVVAEGPP